MSLKSIHTFARRMIARIEKDVSVPKEWITKQEALKRRLILHDTEDWQFRSKETLNPLAWSVRDVSHRRNWFTHMLYWLFRFVDKLRQILFIKHDEKRNNYLPDVKYIGGFDISYSKENINEAYVGFAVVDADTSQLVYSNCTYVSVDCPYIPGYLGFREVEYFVKEWEMLTTNSPQVLPQIIIVDGNGTLHPQRFGAACHLGVLVDVPTIGVAKNLFCIEGLERNNTHEAQINTLERKGDYFLLFSEHGDVLGAALKTSEEAKKPVYVSIGHRCNLQTALWIVSLCSKYRVPEPVRFADIATRQSLRRSVKELDKKNNVQEMSEGIS